MKKILNLKKLTTGNKKQKILKYHQKKNISNLRKQRDEIAKSIKKHPNESWFNFNCRKYKALSKIVIDPLEEQEEEYTKKQLEHIKKLVLKNLFCINLLTTKTNHFCSITTYIKGHVLFLETPRMQGFKHTLRRKDTAFEATLYSLMKKFFKSYSRKTSQFIIQFTAGRKYNLVKKALRLLMKRVRLKKHQIYLIKMRDFFSHNGCKRQVRRRKKRKGRRTIIKPNLYHERQEIEKPEDEDEEEEDFF